MVINDYRRSSIKFDVRGIRISADEIFFYTGLVLWLIQVYISRTVLYQHIRQPPGHSDPLFLHADLCSQDRPDRKDYTEESCCSISHSSSSLCSGTAPDPYRNAADQILLLVYAARNIPFKRICTVMLWTCLPLWLLPVMTDKIGIHQLERSIYIQRVREYLNFNYVSFPSIYFT